MNLNFVTAVGCFALLLPAAVPAAIIVPDTAVRTLRAEASAFESSASAFESTPGLDAFSGGQEALAGAGTAGEARGFAGMDTDDLNSPTLAAFGASGLASAGTGTGDPDTFASGFANFSFRFIVDEPVIFSLSGFLSVEPDSDTFVLLLEDGVPLFERETTGSFSATGLLSPASTYTLFARADAEAAGEALLAASGFNLDFAVTVVPEPAAMAGLAAAGLLGFVIWRRR